MCHQRDARSVSRRCSLTSLLPALSFFGRPAHTEPSCVGCSRGASRSSRHPIPARRALYVLNRHYGPTIPVIISSCVCVQCSENSTKLWRAKYSSTTPSASGSLRVMPNSKYTQPAAKQSLVSHLPLQGAVCFKHFGAASTSSSSVCCAAIARWSSAEMHRTRTFFSGLEQQFRRVYGSLALRNLHATVACACDHSRFAQSYNHKMILIYSW